MAIDSMSKRDQLVSTGTQAEVGTDSLSGLRETPPTVGHSYSPTNI